MDDLVRGQSIVPGTRSVLEIDRLQTLRGDF